MQNTAPLPSYLATSRYASFVLRHLPDWGWWLLLPLAYALTTAARLWLDASYAASRFPVPFYVGQTTFDAAELKGYYAHLMEQGTLGIFHHTQVIDYAFMATSYLYFFVLGAACLRLLPLTWRAGWWGRLAAFMLWFVPLAAVSDAFENAVSFITLANPQHFADWLVYPYSSFAVIKFALFTLGYLWGLSVLLIAGPVRIWQHLRPTIRPSR